GLISAFPFNPGDARLAYAQSFSMVTFVIDTWGDEAILEIVNQYAEGSSHDDVLREAVGMDLSELEQRWLASLDDRYGAVAA
ncbi:MAG: peptidase MA family metallohydrolase, partial [Chloroflexota bacterium]|nr:peptidase MA family metallohydrolase [Chloroflexota bacterium]